MRVLNHTTPLQSRYGGEPIAHRLTLQENQRNQRVLLQVDGDVPEYNLNCKRWCILYYLLPTYHEEAPVHSVGCTKLKDINISRLAWNYKLDCFYGIGFHPV